MTLKTVLFPIVLCSLLASPAFSGIAVKAEYAYDQQGVTSFAGGEEVVGNIERTVTLPNAIYDFDVIASAESFYELKSQASIGVNIDGRRIDGFSGDGWESTQARAVSSSQLVDTAIVDGLSGQVGGVVEFLWSVTGASTIALDPKLRSDAYFIEEAQTTAFFNTLEDDGIPELLVNSQNQPLGASSIDSTRPGFFAPVSIFVDWLVGEELDVFFELQTTASIKVRNFDAAGFVATVDSDFSNTAVLDQIRIYDEDGNLLPNAYLLGEGDFIYDPAGLGLGAGGMGGGGTGGGGVTDPGTGGGGGTGGGANPDPNPVPEPSTIAIWLTLAGLLVVRETRRRK